MGRSYTLGALPESVTSNPHFQEGKRRRESGEGLSPGYFEAIEEAARHVRAWLGARLEAASPLPELRFLEWDSDRTFIAADLLAGIDYLADSPDARALLTWLDEVTGKKLSLNQAGWALRLAGLMPMPKEGP